MPNASGDSNVAAVLAGRDRLEAVSAVPPWLADYGQLVSWSAGAMLPISPSEETERTR